MMKMTRRGWLCSVPFLALSARELLAGEDDISPLLETADAGTVQTLAAVSSRVARVVQETSVRVTATRTVGMMQETSYGSGVVIEPRGYVVTAHHMIRDADAVKVMTAESRHLAAEPVRIDRDYDLALLKADFSPSCVASRPAAAKGNWLGKRALVVGASESPACPCMLHARIGECRTVVWDGRRALLTSVEVDVSGGFSGSGCFDAASGHLLGVVVAKSTRCPRCGYLVPAHRIAEILKLRTERGERPTELHQGTPT